MFKIGDVLIGKNGDKIRVVKVLEGNYYGFKYLILGQNFHYYEIGKCDWYPSYRYHFEKIDGYDYSKNILKSMSKLIGKKFNSDMLRNYQTKTMGRFRYVEPNTYKYVFFTDDCMYQCFVYTNSNDLCNKVVAYKCNLSKIYSGRIESVIMSKYINAKLFKKVKLNEKVSIFMIEL